MKPDYKFNKTELLVLNGILKKLKSMRATDRQTEDLIDDKLSGRNEL